MDGRKASNYLAVCRGKILEFAVLALELLETVIKGRVFEGGQLQLSCSWSPKSPVGKKTVPTAKRAYVALLLSGLSTSGHAGCDFVERRW